MTIIFRDNTETDYWVIRKSVGEFSYRKDIGQFIFVEYKSIDTGNEYDGMFHGGGALVVSHAIPIDVLKDVSQSPEYLFAGDSDLYIWRDEEDSNNFVVAGESWVENLV